MRKTLVAGAALIISISSTAFSGQKVDPFLDVFSPTGGGMKAVGFSKSTAQQPTKSYEVFIKSGDIESTRKAVRALGGNVRIAVGNILTTTVPLDAVEKLAARKEVIFIEAAKPIFIHNDVAMTEINGEEVHEGVDLPKAVTGANTIVGIVDTGIDYTHPDFKDESGKSRVLYIWDQTGSIGRGPEEIEDTYGTECDGSLIDAGGCPVVDENGHGTHITGTAAGRSETYGGVAPDASIIAVRYKAEIEFSDGYAYTAFSTTICEGAYYVFKKAEELGMPAVVNLSLGTHIGPHDGTSLFEECLDSLVEGSSGRAIVAAAGNETSIDPFFTGLHAGYDVDGNTATNFWPRDFSAGRLFYLDIWATKGSELSFGLQLNKGDRNNSQAVERSEMIALGDYKDEEFLSGRIAYRINATETESPLNGRPHVGIAIMFDSSLGSPEPYNFDLLVSGKGHFDAWLFPDKPSNAINFTNLEGDYDGVEYKPGDRVMNISIPATAKNVIGVAGYTTRNFWEHGTNCCQIIYPLGDILEFSSSGPSANPDYTGQKPEIAAPGAMIASTRARGVAAEPLLIMSDGQHVLMAGTSMATPFVAGTVALMFSVNPNFTYSDVEDYITKSAYTDGFVGDVPNDRWGYGKLDVLDTVSMATAGKASGSSSNPELTAPEDSSDGQSSCQLMRRATQPQGEIIIFVLLTLSAILTVRYRSTD